MLELLTVKINTQMTIIASVLALYVAIIALYKSITGLATLWPFGLFILITVYAGYVLYRLKQGNVGKSTVIILALQAILSTILLFPSVGARIIDRMGLGCTNWSGEAVKCVDSISFANIDLPFAIMIPMLILSIYSFIKLK